MKIYLIIIGTICFYATIILVKKSYRRETAFFKKEDIVETYPCLLMAQNVYEQEYEGWVWDFSKYKDNQVIGMQIYTKDKKPKEIEDGITEPILIKTVVYKMKNGNYVWDHTKRFD